MNVIKTDILKKQILDLAFKGFFSNEIDCNERTNKTAEIINESIKKHLNINACSLLEDDTVSLELDKNGSGYTLPKNWISLKLEYVYDVISGLTYKKENLQQQTDNMVRIIRGGNISNNKAILKSDDLYISQNFIKTDLYLKSGDIITPSVSSLEQIGKTALINNVDSLMVPGGFVYLFRPKFKNELLDKFFYYVFLSNYHQANCKVNVKKSGSAFYNLNKSKISSFRLPIPPYKQIKTIVEKVDKLFKLIDSLDIYQTEIFNTKMILKEKILNFAFSGKLTNKKFMCDENIYTEIEKERNELIRSGLTNKKIDKNNFINSDKINDSLPSCWLTTNLGNICIVKGGKRIPAGEKFSEKTTPYKYLRVKDMKNNTIIGCTYISPEIHEKIKNYKIFSSDIYITVAGTIGEVGDIPSEYSGSNLTENADKLIPSRFIQKEWLLKWLQSPICKKQISDVITKVGQPKLSIKNIENLIIDIPPYEEQCFLNEKIDKIFNLLEIK